jgi:hypothetical protein
MAAFGYKDRTKTKSKGPKLKSMILAPDGNKYPSTCDPQLFPQLADTDPISCWLIEDKPNEKGRMRSQWVEKKFLKKVVSLATADDIIKTEVPEVEEAAPIESETQAA